MILSHLNYCLTNWSQANRSTLKPLESQYKQAIKILDKKTKLFHHWSILKKYQLLSWEDLQKYFNVCLVFKVTHNLAPPPVAEYINRRTGSDRVTRGSLRGDCVILLRKSTFNQSAWSVKSAKEWNSIPQHIRELNTYTSLLSS